MQHKEVAEVAEVAPSSRDDTSSDEDEFEVTCRSTWQRMSIILMSAKNEHQLQLKKWILKIEADVQGRRIVRGFQEGEQEFPVKAEQRETASNVKSDELQELKEEPSACSATNTHTHEGRNISDEELYKVNEALSKKMTREALYKVNEEREIFKTRHTELDFQQLQI